MSPKLVLTYSLFHTKVRLSFMNWTEFPTKSTQWPNVTFEIHQIRTKLCCFNSIDQICRNEAASAICTFHISAVAAVHMDRRTSRCGRRMCPRVPTNDLLYSDGHLYICARVIFKKQLDGGGSWPFVLLYI